MAIELNVTNPSRNRLVTFSSIVISTPRFTGSSRGIVAIQAQMAPWRAVVVRPDAHLELKSDGKSGINLYVQSRRPPAPRIFRILIQVH